MNFDLTVQFDLKFECASYIPRALWAIIWANKLGNPRVKYLYLMLRNHFVSQYSCQQGVHDTMQSKSRGTQGIFFTPNNCKNNHSELYYKITEVYIKIM